MAKYTQKDIGKRVIYTGRNGNQMYGRIQGLIGVSSSQFLDLKLDNSKREHFSVPEDACVLVPEELSPLMRDSDDS